jgi:hypothetical protein
MNKKISPWRLRQRVDGLPKDLRHAFYSSETSDTIRKIATEYDVLEGVDVLAEITGSVMIGLIPITDFRKSLEDNLFVDEVKARNIANAVRELIFKDIAASLRKVHNLK